MNISELLDKKHSFAIIGASNNPDKFGYKIYRQLKNSGIEVFPINNKEPLIQGDQAYVTLADLPAKVDVLNFIVPPAISLQITKNALALGFKIFWYQPGSFDQEILEFHEGKNTIVISDQCLLVESQKL